MFMMIYFRDGSQRKAKLNYLKVPLLLNINIGPSKRVKLQLGPQIGGVLKETVDSLKNNGDIFKKSDWAAVGGLWIQIPFINLGARYEIGLTNLNDIDNQGKMEKPGFYHICRIHILTPHISVFIFARLINGLFFVFSLLLNI